MKPSKAPLALPGSCLSNSALCFLRSVQAVCPVTCGMCHNGTGGSARTNQPSTEQQVLYLAYLSSYEHMGRALVSCAGDACTCGPNLIDAHNSIDRTSITAIQRLQLSWSMEAPTDSTCELNVTVQHHTSSGSHKFKLLGLLLQAPEVGHRRSTHSEWRPPGAMLPQADLANSGRGHHIFFPGMDSALVPRFSDLASK
eukprot:4350387-Prymnesium_polylepis.1